MYRCVLTLLFLAHAGASCSGAISCMDLDANGLTFQCRTSGPVDGTPVLLLHGFPNWADMFAPFMTRLADEGFHSVACNMRGYSPGASPDGQENYLYDTLISDVWAIVDAVGFDSGFHLVAHDHGAVMGWVIAASDRGASEILSYTSLSVPHVDAFSEGLCGPEADFSQQVASQYATMFVQPNSASQAGGFWFGIFAIGNADSGFGTVWGSAAAFQKPLWWYNGVVDDGYLASPPILEVSEIPVTRIAQLRGLFGGDSTPCVVQPNPVGPVSMPVLYVCGTGDQSILCDLPYARKTADYVDSDYENLVVDCGHDLLACSDSNTTAEVEDAIINHLITYTPTEPVSLSCTALDSNPIPVTDDWCTSECNLDPDSDSCIDYCECEPVATSECEVVGSWGFPVSFCYLICRAGFCPSTHCTPACAEPEM